VLVEYTRIAISGIVSGSAGHSGPAEIRLVEFGPRERRRRAWLGLAGWWAVAGMCAFLPVGRGVLVVGFAGFGIYSAVRRSRTEQVVVEVIGDCPECGAGQTLTAPEAWGPPAPLTCRACRAVLAFSADPVLEPS
jgi:hypothetical protein